MEQLATLIQLGDIELAADICVPERARGLVLFAMAAEAAARAQEIATSPKS